MRSLLIVAEPDHDEVRGFHLPADLMSLYLSAKGDLLCSDGTAFLPETLTAQALAMVSASAEGQQVVDQALSVWRLHTDIPAPEFIDLKQLSTRERRRSHALSAVADLYRKRLGATIQHNTQLLEMLSSLRMEHEQSVRMVRSLRSFISGSLGTTRWLAQANGPLPLERAPNLELPSSGILTQRIAASSMGLSDLALFLPDQDLPEQACLHAELSLAESSTIASTWTLDASELSTGWVRLSLPSALDDDEQTPHLRLSWQADRPLLLGGGVFHPDPDHCVEINGQRFDRILASRLWKHTPGGQPPIPSDGHWTDGPLPPRFYVDPFRLSEVAKAAGDELKFFEETGALQVHPRVDTTSFARLAGAVRPGVRRVRATIAGRHPQGPRVAYALAAAPRRPVRRLPDLIQNCERAGRISDWAELSGDRESELDLFLVEPADQALDLYLMTRPGPGARPAHGWATFRDIWLFT